MEHFLAVILGIVSAVATLSPIITAFINNRYNTKMKKIEIYELAKQESLKNFVNSCSAYFSVDPDEKLRIEVLSSMHILLIYFEIDEVLQNTILEAINNRKHKLLNEVIANLTNQIHKEIKPLKI